MRVRHLQTFLQDQKLVMQNSLENLHGFRVGIDAVYWTRTLSGLKDPFADALGGLPPAMYGVIDRELDQFKKNNISPVFIFQGMQPRSHQLFSSQLHQQMDDAWQLLTEGDRFQAQQRFAQATSRINSDFTQFVFHYLRTKDCECIQAPYFATAQIAYFVDKNYFDAVFGPPALLLYGVSKVVIGIDWKNEHFDWVELSRLLQTWSVNKEQFVDACLLAGTEYCLTFPYLNLTQFHAGTAHFTFGTAIEFIKQAPLISYMQHFPNEEMKNDHVDGYCTCRALIQYPLVMQLDGEVGPPHPSTAMNQTVMLPSDFSKIVGSKLPSALYYLLTKGVISRKIPTVLATGEWYDFSHPTVDSNEYRDLLNDLKEYRGRALGLVAMRLHKSFQERAITFSRYSCNQNGGNQSESANEPEPPKCHEGFSWVFTAEDLQGEQERQKKERKDGGIIDLRFCLAWHHQQAETGATLFSNLRSKSGSTMPSNQDTLLALVQLMLLENVGYFTREDGGMTVFGSALVQSPREFQEHALFALELMKVGCLSGDPLEAPLDRPFPKGVKYVKSEAANANQRSALLLSRLMSLIPMKLKSHDMWNADVDFDLAAFHSIVKILKRTLRQMVEACVAHILLKDVTKEKFLPKDYMNPVKENPPLPTFMLPRNCMGVAVKFFLDYKAPDPSSTPSQQRDAFREALQKAFPACLAPYEDLQIAIRFWKEMMRIVDHLAETIDIEDFKSDMQQADAFLQEKLKLLDIKEPASA
ncbi:unnamed protein product [Vitrella brassicaformis CCMP3155]|uniref:XPG N-terminal domain-containing protein n=1 Tax=Vitrella brassicaformis (strain CCMP3155) TaxID=1169540 RepID=A0A0G4EFT2_VITBC|nr:unnamed protein product [Vitrella brassicaformis CCMP3155]|mmetsp:Transcript_17009/g.40842  ORF Transcript_17009/g.40842 Transcript_17009/m.40842 type:complete len:754 (-) Transcript_17009:292-2553(-)|eukprot:CEL95401.1 unnamed protein product [Vitrella brassicaformis CCMP3155]